MTILKKKAVIFAGLVLLGTLGGSSVASARTCEVALWLDDAVTLGALQLTIDYSTAFGSWKTTAKGMDCANDAPNSLAMIVNDPVHRIVTGSILSLGGIVGPRKLAHCYFIDPGATVLPGNFVVEVSEAARTDGGPAKAPTILVLLPDCGPVTTTTTSTTTTSTTITTTTSTTTSTTSTTLPDCGNGIVDDIEQCDDGNTADDDGCDAACSSDVVCGDANGNDTVQTSDALLVLRAAIGQAVNCPVSRCDADGDNTVRANDSLRVLKRSVGQSVVMSCPT